ncbi:helix-turn-helix transcriptional regulator [Fructobacillus sp. EFB-N1]|uniref:helix-turn-helix transcriptional regulator n=1 Tax=Fructobacillus sp. EFB-N1 TaxID=1658766 RepID=UPI00064DC827|nr:helix-turn-helix transcriptional regulator [Fructobacillus sp. EFB-N1]
MNRIKQLRTEKNIGQDQLADYLGVSRQTISHYERGDREPKLENWRKLTDYFGVKFEYLVGWED